METKLELQSIGKFSYSIAGLERENHMARNAGTGTQSWGQPPDDNPMGHRDLTTIQ